MKQAYAMELEAATRYAEFADQMEVANNREVAELFRKLAGIEKLHATKILEQMGWKTPPTDLAPFRWEGLEGPETGEHNDLHYLMQPYHALQIALRNEQHAAFFHCDHAPRRCRARCSTRRGDGRGGTRARRAGEGLDGTRAEAARRAGTLISIHPTCTTERRTKRRRRNDGHPASQRLGTSDRLRERHRGDRRQRWCSSPARSAGTRRRSSTPRQLAPQFEQALKNVLAVLAEAGGRPEHICRITAFCCDKPAYLAARKDLGRHLEGPHGQALPLHEHDLRLRPARQPGQDRAGGDRRRAVASARAPAARSGGTSAMVASMARFAVPLIVLAQLFGTSLWFSANAAADSLVRVWGLSTGDIGLLTNAVQLGFIAGTFGVRLLRARGPLPGQPHRRGLRGASARRPTPPSRSLRPVWPMRASIAS